MASTNYYGRLARYCAWTIFDSEAGRVCLPRDRSAALGFGQRWLEREQGEHGLPTAYGVGVHRHIGLPLSQALIRAADRRNLHRLFASVGLSPGEAIGLDDMFQILMVGSVPLGRQSVEPYGACGREAMKGYVSGSPELRLLSSRPGQAKPWAVLMIPSLLVAATHDSAQF